ncbi:HU family DNA-binding protein [Paraburkholderia sp. GAS199]|uniref:HU family DNA-binding protein n=1 Tax=Paraburkholderia sp. GAS199 TaxID=3035126 RepID=UPI003D19215A
MSFPAEAIDAVDDVESNLPRPDCGTGAVRIVCSGQLAARTGCHPSNGEKTQATAAKTVKVAAGKNVKERVNARSCHVLPLVAGRDCDGTCLVQSEASSEPMGGPPTWARSIQDIAE